MIPWGFFNCNKAPGKENLLSFDRRHLLFIGLFRVFSAAAFKRFQQALIQIGQRKAQKHAAADIREPVYSGEDSPHDEDYQ